jgi:class 3 adenylate cyclase
VLDEPVRGAVPDRSVLSLSGLEQLRGVMRGLIAPLPIAVLMDAHLTEASSGSSVARQVLSPWFAGQGGSMTFTPIADLGMASAALTGAPPATEARTINVSLRFLRPCTIEAETAVVRSRILHAGSAFSTVEALIEDRLGRAVAHATASVLLLPIEPKPPPLATPLQPVEEPIYATPVPARRPMPWGRAPWLGAVRERVSRGVPVQSGERVPMPPAVEFMGAHVVELSPGRARIAVPASEWFCALYPSVQPGMVGSIGEGAVGLAIATVAEPDQQVRVNHIMHNLLAPVRAGGQKLTAVGTVRHRGDVVVCEAEVSEPDGTLVAISQITVLLRSEGSAGRARPPERLLLTVLFTDLVGSTELAGRLGPEQWRALLEDHHALVRRQLELHRGREVKCTGDGFLATFDSPSRAVACARDVRAGLDRLDLPVRIGIHAGECEVMGSDVGGLAVHLASRIEAAAAPREILVSSTVQAMLAGSGVGFVDRGRHALKGVDGEHQLFAIADTAGG